MRIEKSGLAASLDILFTVTGGSFCSAVFRSASMKTKHDTDFKEGPVKGKRQYAF